MSRQTGRHDDPSECVIDELAGQWLACAFAGLSFGGLIPAAHISLIAFALAFALFRLFDILEALADVGGGKAAAAASA